MQSPLISQRIDGPERSFSGSSAPALFGLWAVVFLCLSAIGCASSPDPDPPDLGASIDATDARFQSLDAFESSVGNDLDRLEMLGKDLEDLTQRVTVAELPLSLLRLVALNCLNSPYDGGVTDTGVLGTTPLTCTPDHIDRLVEALEQAATADRDRAHELLYLVDQTRYLRGSVRQRMGRLADSANDHLDFIADERAMLRQVESDLQQRKNLYSSEGFKDARAAIDEHREHLDDLAARIEELADEYVTWTPRIDAVISEVYFELSYLRAEGGDG